MLFFVLIVTGLVACGDDSPTDSPPINQQDYFWFSKLPNPFSNFRATGVAAIDTLVITVSSDSVNTVILSGDRGESWTFVPGLADSIFHGMRRIGNEFMAVSQSNFYRSTDGQNWQAANWPLSPDSFDCFCNLQDIARNSDGSIWVGTALIGIGNSSDGDSWTLTNRPFIVADNVWFRSIVFDGTQFVVLATNFDSSRTDIFTSTDGTTWILKTSIDDANLVDLTVSNVGWIAVGELGAIYFSTDQSTWTKQDAGTLADLLAVRWGNNEFAAVGLAGTILISKDGITWERQDTRTDRTLLDIIWTGTRYIAVGENVILVTSL